MTSDTERPRQRTVAELLAEHGDAASSSRRRRRRTSDDENAESVATVGVTAATGQVGGQRTAPGHPPAPETPQPRQPSYGQSGTDDRLEAYRAVSRPLPPETPTDVMPRVPASTPPAAYEPGYQQWSQGGGPDVEATGPIAQVAEAAGATAAGSAEATTAVPARAPEDGGPPTEFAPRVQDQDDEDAHEWDEDWSDDQWDDEQHAGADQHDRDRRRGADGDGAEGPPTGFYDVESEEYGKVGTAEDGEAPGLAEEDAEAEHDPDAQEERAPRSGPSWPAVIAQWIAGAIGGAALWVAFRYLWKGFPIVAVAAALLVTVGLVIIVRGLLHNRDLRTTIFAVLVGLLLTASPAVLVLIGR
ncbi:hypothetical protein [Pseudonocardia sp.]|uniref:hypothetical protein n=1 Tax=Pseudonocardia sp. TaxID=60912 RepID=UPI003D13BE07